MTALGRLPRRSGTSTGMLTRSFLCPRHVSVSRRDEKRVDIRSIPSTAGVDHDGATKLAFTEPALPKWVFSQRRG